MTSPHPDIAALGFLCGTWMGEGTGQYPTIEGFRYRETVTITTSPKPVLAYGQRTVDADDGAPLHAESGWFRLPDGVPELTVSQPTGIVEVHRGSIGQDGRSVILRSTGVLLTPSAAAHRVTDVIRRIAVEDDVLHYTLDMAAVGQPLQLHLSARLVRQPQT